MGIELEFISREFIKPSSPTPDHLRKHKFSSIDQNQYPVSMPIVLFYENSSNISDSEKSNLLKQSLSKALTIFYPLAGRINNHSYAECNDEGALFIETKANCPLSCILKNRNDFHHHSNKFIPFQPDKTVRRYGCLIQVTHFNCGGIAVSCAMPHMLGDACSQITFLTTWAAVTRGNTRVVDVPFVSDSVFPQRKIPGFDLTQWVFKENIVTKAFVFDGSTLAGLRDRYSTSGERLISRVQALSAFILYRLMVSTNKTDPFMVINAVNIRQRLDPPISEESFGNLAWMAADVININVTETSGNEDEACHEIGKRIRDSIRDVNAETLKEVQKGGLQFAKETFMECLKGDMVMYTFTSWCTFPIYETDFGWGKPERVTTSGMIFNNLVIFLDTKESRGIEAWISLTEEDMAKFENDFQLVSHISSVPN